MFKKIIFGGLVVFGIIVIIALAGIYKFGYLSGKDGYDVDGNKIILEKENIRESVDQVQSVMKNEKNVSILISPQEFKQRLETGEYVLVDIRTDKEDKQEKIPGTKLILDFYKDDFVEQVSKLDKNKKYLYYFRTGHRSGEVSNLAERFNFAKAFELNGGIVAWKKAGYATETEKKKWYKPRPGISWQWQLSNPVNTSYQVDLYDIDLVETPQGIIDRLHRDGRKVICYFSAGSWENYRSDAKNFPTSVIGRTMDDWPDEKWLNIAQYQKFAGIMQARMDLAVKKKCDGIEPDNIDGYTNKTGFKISAQDQLRYNKWLASEAHKRGLAIALKNDIEQVGQLVNDFDFAINEQCFEYDECGALQAFTKQGKAVLGAEYELKKKKFCSQAKAMNFSWLKMDYDLNGGRDGC